jgi:putative membrane protein
MAVSSVHPPREEEPMTGAGDRVLREAAISPNATRYQLISTAAVLGGTIVGIPLLVAVLPVTKWYFDRYYANLRVILTNRDLKVHRGILVREEKSIPLEKITDLRVYQGPIMRRMGLKGLAVETAGQTSQQGALVSVVGLEDVDGFRDAALSQRDRVSDSEEVLGPMDGPQRSAPSGVFGDGSARSDGPAPETAMLEALTDIRDTLRRMEKHLSRETPDG